MTRFSPPAVLLAALAAAVAALPAPAPACAPAPPNGERVDVADEAALIVWDEATKTQHFIRRATFQSTAYDFGFLVPTPTRPELAEATDEVFHHLARVTAPKVEYHTRAAAPGCEMKSTTFAVGEAAPKAGVVVLDQKKVGDFDAVVLGFQRGKGDDPKAGAADLAAWLVRHGYGFGDHLAAWLVPYVRDNWVVTAFRVAGQPAGDPARPKPGATGKDAAPPRPGPTGLRASPVRMSFKTDRPFFPYREPADQRDDKAKAVPRFLRVYYVSTQRAAGTLGDGSAAWPGRTVWADKLAPAEGQTVAANAKLPAGLPAGDLWLTEFEDASTPRPGTDEVYFAPAADQSPVARLPLISYLDDYSAWYTRLALFVGIPVLLLVGLVGWRLARRRPPQPDPTPRPPGNSSG